MEEMRLEQQERLMETLREQPQRLEPGCGGVEVLETHISWVLLTDHYAFKFKKAIDLGFLDYSTLEKRRQFCHEEQRLNRRTAPELYLDVIALGGSPNAPTPDSEPVIEYAVKMRRFGEGALLDTWASEGRLRAEHIDAMARSIARFHGRVPSAAADTPYGEPETLYHPVLENFEQLRQSLDDSRKKLWVEQQALWVARQFTRLRHVFEQRKAEGFVRECHGDLHLGNLAEVDGRIVPFDCIEFNPALRWIDVLSELAFLLMDLEHRGLSPLAWRLLDRYLQHTGDYQGLAVLRFYQHYRAMVRAKVSLIRLEQPDLTQAERLHIIEELGAYLTLAAEYTRPAQPALLLTFGPSGSGKTFLADQLLEQLGAIRIRSDVERKRLFGLAADESSDSQIDAGIYAPEATHKTYQRLLELAQAVLSAGYPCIVDATFLRRSQREPFLALAKRCRIPATVLELRTAPATLERRVAGRTGDASEANRSVLQRQLATMEVLSTEEQRLALSVDTDSPVDAVQLAGGIRERLSYGQQR